MDNDTKVAILDSCVYAIQGAETLVQRVTADHADGVKPAVDALLGAAVSMLQLVQNATPAPTSPPPAGQAGTPRPTPPPARR